MFVLPPMLMVPRLMIAPGSLKRGTLSRTSMAARRRAAVCVPCPPARASDTMRNERRLSFVILTESTLPSEKVYVRTPVVPVGTPFQDLFHVEYTVSRP